MRKPRFSLSYSVDAVFVCPCARRLPAYLFIGRAKCCLHTSFSKQQIELSDSCWRCLNLDGGRVLPRLLHFIFSVSVHPGLGRSMPTTTRSLDQSTDPVLIGLPSVKRRTLLLSIDQSIRQKTPSLGVQDQRRPFVSQPCGSTVFEDTQKLRIGSMLNSSFENTRHRPG